MPISGPSHSHSQQDRFLECEEDLETEFQALVWRAIKAGWDEGEACAAIASLADHHILAIDCNNRTSASIRKLRE
jgi:hypothetical protein